MVAQRLQAAEGDLVGVGEDRRRGPLPGEQQLRRGDLRKADFTAVGYDQDQSFMLVEIADKEMTFQSISRTGQTVDKGFIVQRAGAEPIVVGGSTPASPTPVAKPPTPGPATPAPAPPTPK